MVGSASGLLKVSSGGATLTIDDSAANPSTVSHVVINGLGGNDTLSVSNLSGVHPLLLELNGGEGNDLLDAMNAGIGTVRTAFNGSNGNDTINGSTGSDPIHGGAAARSLSGHRSNDT